MAFKRLLDRIAARDRRLTAVAAGTCTLAALAAGALVQQTPALAVPLVFLGGAGAAFALSRLGQRPQPAVGEQRESDARFRLVADDAPVMLWMGDAEGGGLYLNRMFRDFWGHRTPESLAGMGWFELVHPEDRESLKATIVAGVASHAPFTMSPRLMRADGQWRLIDATAVPRFRPCGAFKGFISVCHDVTEARAADAARLESETRFRLIADSASVFMWVSELGARFVFVNRAYLDFAGVTYEEALQKSFVERLHPDDRDRVLGVQAAGMASRKPFAFEARFQRADGEWRWLRAQATPRKGPGGEHAGYVGVAVDVTEAKQAESDLKRINELLEERVAAALAEKADAEAALFHARKMEAVGQLTGGVAHDFNNLLTVVIGALDMILKHPEDGAKRRRLGEAALAAARRGERLTHQLLAFSRRQALRPETCDVNALIRDGEPLTRRAVGEAIAFDLRLSEGAATARVDTAQFDAALLNLVVNARDATSAGGEITVETERLDVSADQVPELAPGAYVVVRVRDSGVGMSADVLSQVFEPFFTTKPAGKGTGLGLSQVYGFARQSGGVAHLESAEGRGTTVALYLPAAESQPEAARPRTVGTPSTRVLRVLLVEDDPSVAVIAETMLVELGHAVMRAENAEQALKLLHADRPVDLLLTDVIMPGGVNGVELARLASVLRPGLAVLLSSGYAGETVDAALAEAPWPFLKKPYDADELAATLQALAPSRETETA
ncbi:PAS domain-containing sensor histidine kinase [Caulobacter sp. 17J80-11]|uniref:hybrid sensor histidine kinase/response regulator n=1 Tax=Caulobacter sp. 17J80-11 TaxID=2763502 RepID=UPI0016534BBA|nr:PAS domain S-box protein [Caulobacter sp. 17J80-11]